MAEKSAPVGSTESLSPAEIRAEMTATRARISASIDAVEAQIWRQIGTVLDSGGSRGKVSMAGTLLGALVLAERVGALRYLKARIFKRRSRT